MVRHKAKSSPGQFRFTKETVGGASMDRSQASTSVPAQSNQTQQIGSGTGQDASLRRPRPVRHRTQLCVG